MAIDYGFWSTLSTGYKSAQDRKSQRDSESLKELQYMQMLQQQQTQRINQQNAVQQQIQQAEATATQILNSSFGRQKDIDDMKTWHAEHSGWGDIKNVIQQYNGDYTQARLQGNLDYYINQYKMNINNPDADPTKGNPILRRVANNKANLTNFTAAMQDPETQKLIMSGDLERYKAYLNGETDEFDYRGMRGDWDLSTMMEDVDNGKEISYEDFYFKNRVAILSDMSKDTGIDRNTLEENPQAIEIWTRKNLGWEEDQEVYGTKEIETSYALQFRKNLDAIPQLLFRHKGSADGFTVNDVLDMEAEFGNSSTSGFQQLLESLDPENDNKAYTELWAGIGGYDTDSRAYDKWIGSGDQMNTSGQILTEKNIQTAVLKAQYGDAYFSENGTINNMQSKGLYNENGVLVTDDDITGTWYERALEVGGAAMVTTGASTAIFNAAPGVGTVAWGATTAIGTGVGVVSGALGLNPFGEEETMDLKYNGTYLGFRMTGVNPQTGQPTSMLITRNTDKNDLQKIRDNMGNRPVEVVMINELIDSDTFSADDAFYDVVDLNNVSFRDEMEKMTDSESLSKVINEDKSYKTKVANAAYYEDQKDRLALDLANIYTEGNTEILPEVATSYKSNIETSLVVGGVSAENGHLTSPMIMSWLLTESEKASEGDMAQTNKNFEKMTSELSGLINKDGALRDALKQGPKGFMNWYSKNTDKETFKKFQQTNKKWSKYFTLKK